MDARRVIHGQAHEAHCGLGVFEDDRGVDRGVNATPRTHMPVREPENPAPRVVFELDLDGTVFLLEVLPVRGVFPRDELDRLCGTKQQYRKLQLVHHFGSLVSALVQSITIPVSLMTLAHFTRSDRMCASNSLIEPPAGSASSVSRRARISSSRRIRLISSFNLLAIAADTPARVNMPNQVETSKPGRPASSNVGTAGKSGERRGAEIAIGLSCPLLTNGAPTTG